MSQHTPDHAMKLGLVLDISENSLKGHTPTFQEIKDMGQAAEGIGFDSLWIPDHLIFRFPEQEEGGQFEVFTFLSALAAVTKRVALGPLVACTSFRSPALLAKMADSLDQISEGRFILGLGAGWHKPEYDAFGFPFDALASRFEEALSIIVPLLREGQVDFQGRYYQASNCVMRPRGPTRGGPPIWIGARRPRMLKLIARYADAWNTVWHTEPEDVTKQYALFQEACREVGRDPAAIELTAGVIVRLEPSAEASPGKAISGSLEDIAAKLRGFSDVGVKHLNIVIDGLDLAHVERFAPVIQMLK